MLSAVAAAALAPGRIVASFIVRVVIITIIFIIGHAAEVNPWVQMMEDTKATTLLLHKFSDHFSHAAAADAAAAAYAAAIDISSRLLSLKSRYSNLCTAAYGGYDGKRPLPVQGVSFE
jgi:hypothetical protein